MQRNLRLCRGVMHLHEMAQITRSGKIAEALAAEISALSLYIPSFRLENQSPNPKNAEGSLCLPMAVYGQGQISAPQNLRLMQPHRFQFYVLLMLTYILPPGFFSSIPPTFASSSIFKQGLDDQEVLCL